MTHPTHAPEAVARAALFDLRAGSWPAVSRDAAEGEADVVTVYHDPDRGGWFGSASEAEVVPQCLACVLTRHPEVSELADLPLDWAAQLREGVWERGPRPREWGAWDDSDEARS